MSVFSSKMRFAVIYMTAVIFFSALSAGASSALRCAAVLRQTQGPRNQNATEQAWDQAVGAFAEVKNFEPALRSMVGQFAKDRAGAELFGQKYSSVELQIAEGSGIEISPGFDRRKPENGLLIQVKVGREELRNPFNAVLIAHKISRIDKARNEMIFEKFPDLNSGYSSSDFFRSFYDWAETNMNARKGSETSKILLELEDINARLEVFDIALKNDRSQVFKRINRSELEEAARLYRRTAVAGIQALSARLRVLVADRKEALQRFAAKPRPQGQLDQLVAANDRVGVAKLISEQLPWELMEPSERSFWLSWIESVRNPSNEKVLVYRGFGGETQKKDADGRVFAFSPIFMDGKNWTQKFAQIQQAYQKIRYSVEGIQFDSTSLLKERERKPIANLPPNMLNLMEGGLKHLSINFSYDPWLAYTFARTGSQTSMGAFLVDKNRLLLNLHSPYVGKDDAEREIHTPFVIFPDEVLHYVEGDFKNGKATFNQFMSVVNQKMGRSQGKASDRDATMVQEGIARFAKEIGL